MHLAEKIVDSSVGVEAFPFNPLLLHSPSLRILFGLRIVPGALQGGIHKGHPEGDRVISCIIHSDNLVWPERCSCPCDVGTLVQSYWDGHQGYSIVLACSQ